MTTVVKRRGGTTSEHENFIGTAREITIDTVKKTVVIHDGETPGGYPLAREDLTNVTRHSIFHGFRKGADGDLLLDTGDGDFIASDYIDWFIAQAPIDFSINANGELIATI
ncbi:MAG: hypothetical protein ACTSXQ_06050 [Alphaproteobacteria bacterium]